MQLMPARMRRATSSGDPAIRLGKVMGLSPGGWRVVGAAMTTLALGACSPDPDSAVRVRQSTPTTVAGTIPPPATGGTETTQGRPGSSIVEVRLDHYAIEPGAYTAPTGRMTLDATNRDAVPHDVVLIRTSLAPERLPTSGVRVDESSPAIEILARTATLKPQRSGSFSVVIGPGTYLLVCTVPHHYVREAMVATLTVSG